MYMAKLLAPDNFGAHYYLTIALETEGHDPLLK